MSVLKAKDPVTGEWLPVGGGSGNGSGAATMQPLTLTGAVSATYDGSEAVSVELPTSGWENYLSRASVQVNGATAIPATTANLFNAFYIAVYDGAASSIYTLTVPAAILSTVAYKYVLPDGYSLTITKNASGQITIVNTSTSTSALLLHIFGLV